MKPEENKNNPDTPQPAAMSFGPTKPKLVIQPLEGSTLTQPSQLTTPPANPPTATDLSVSATPQAPTPPLPEQPATAPAPILNAAPPAEPLPSAPEAIAAEPVSPPVTAAPPAAPVSQPIASPPTPTVVSPPAPTPPTPPVAPVTPPVPSSSATPTGIPVAPQNLPYQPAPPTTPVVVQPENPQPQPIAQAQDAAVNQQDTSSATTESTAPTPPQAVVGAVLTPEQEAVLRPPKTPISRKKKLIAIGVPCLIVLLGLGGVFGLYLPNTPDNVWKTAMKRTNTAVERVVESVAATDKLQTYASSEITGDFEAKVMGQTYSGKISTKYDESMSDSGLSVELPGEAGAKNAIRANLITSMPKDATLPDMYFKVSGVSALGLDAFVPGISNYEDKWIVASSAYLSTVADAYVEEAGGQEKQPTAADISEVSIAATDVVREYMFTTDPQKAVLINDEFIDKQELDGLKTYHYKVSINQANATAMCKALIAAVYKTNAYKSVTGADSNKVAQEISDAQKDCAGDAKDAVKEAGAMEAWVDSKYKLIYKVRTYEPKSTTKYTDMGQKYSGGDEFALFASYIDTKRKTEADVRLTVNTKTNVTTLDANYDGGDSGEGTLTITAKPLSGKVAATIPTGAIPIQDVMAAMEAASEAQYSQRNDYNSSYSEDPLIGPDYQEF